MKQIKDKAVEFAALALITNKQVWIDLDGSITFGPNDPTQNQYRHNVAVFLRRQCAQLLFEELKADPNMHSLMVMELLKASPSSITARIGNLLSSWSSQIMQLAREKVMVTGVEHFPHRRPSKRDGKKQKLKAAREAAHIFSQKLSPELQAEFQAIMNELHSFVREP